MQDKVGLMSEHCPLVLKYETAHCSLSRSPQEELCQRGYHFRGSVCARVYKCALCCVNGSVLLKWWNAKQCISGEGLLGWKVGFRRQLLGRKWMRLKLINSHTNTMGAYITRRKTQIGARCCFRQLGCGFLKGTGLTGRWVQQQLVPAGPVGSRSILTFQGKMMRIHHSKEDRWERDAVNTQINNIHSLEEKMR